MVEMFQEILLTLLSVGIRNIHIYKYSFDYAKYQVKKNLFTIQFTKTQFTSFFYCRVSLIQQITDTSFSILHLISHFFDCPKV